jgi:glycosyltransferase involved in cell wall biosynthesis
MDCTRFAARVQELLTDKALARRMGESGRQIVQHEHSVDNYISGLENTFQQVRSERGEPIHA